MLRKGQEVKTNCPPPRWHRRPRCVPAVPFRSPAEPFRTRLRAPALCPMEKNHHIEPILENSRGRFGRRSERRGTRAPVVRWPRGEGASSRRLGCRGNG